MPISSILLRTLTATALLWSAQSTFAANAGMATDTALPDTVTLASPHSFKTLKSRVESAVSAQKMGLVAQASASAGAAARGVKIAGNAVLMVFRNDYAVRMLQASVAAGIEAPLRLYLSESPDGSASLSYRTPSAVFAPYHNAQLNAMAQELDAIFARIADAAVQP